MIRFRTSTEVTDDRRVVLELPPETPVGKAELTVTVAPQSTGAQEVGGLQAWFGAVHSRDETSADNDRVDADLARAYAESHDEGA